MGVPWPGSSTPQNTETLSAQQDPGPQVQETHLLQIFNRPRVAGAVLQSSL